MRLGRRVIASVAFLLAAATAVARADNFEVDPVTVSIAPGMKTADVTIRNHSSHPMRFSVRAYAWTQSATDDLKLQETDDLLAFPDVFDVPAEGAQRIRVGITASPHGSEGAYRLYINEVPQADSAGAHGAQLRIVTRVGIPVFAQVTSAQSASAELTSLHQEGHSVAIALRNAGDAHVIPSSAHLALKDTSGRVVWSQDQSVWYVLPGANRVLTVSVPPSRCKEASSIEVRWLEGAVKTAAWNGALCSH